MLAYDWASNLSATEELPNFVGFVASPEFNNWK
jgi:hypothetical protein